MGHGTSGPRQAERVLSGSPVQPWVLPVKDPSVRHLANLRAAATRVKTVDDPLLNRLGLQVARTVAAHGVARARRWPTPDDPRVAGWVDELRARGCVAVPDFLAPDDLAAVEAAARAVLADDAVPRDVLRDGGNRVEVLWRQDAPLEARADLDRVFTDPRVVALAAAAERIDVAPGAGRCTVQVLTQLDGEPDGQAEIHTDTFHPTHKMWLYLTDVSIDDGPLVYYPGSHRLSVTALRAVHRESRGPNAGSRRIEPGEPERRGLTPRVFTEPANTLVIADTAGYHGRIQGRPPGWRLALELQFRPDPFRRRGGLPEDTSRATPAAPATAG